MPRKKPLFFMGILSSKALSYLLIVLLIFGLVSLVREITYRLSLKSEIVREQTHIQKLEEENQELTDDLLKRKTEYFKEKQARLKFGLSKPGENIVVILEDADEKRSDKERNYLKNKVRNITLWFEYFFK